MIDYKVDEGDIELKKMIVSQFEDSLYIFSNVDTTSMHAMKMQFNQSIIWSIGRSIPIGNKLVSLSIDEQYAVFAGMVAATKSEMIILNSTTGEKMTG